MPPVVTPDLEYRCSLFADCKDLLIVVLFPLLLYLAAECYLPTDWHSRITAFLCFDKPILVSGMGDGSVQEVTDIGTEAKIYFPAITTRGGENVNNLGGN